MDVPSQPRMSRFIANDAHSTYAHASSAGMSSRIVTRPRYVIALRKPDVHRNVCRTCFRAPGNNESGLAQHYDYAHRFPFPCLLASIFFKQLYNVLSNCCERARQPLPFSVQWNRDIPCFLVSTTSCILISDETLCYEI